MAGKTRTGSKRNKPVRKKRTVRKKAAARKTRVRKRPTRRKVGYDPLLALLMFLYMLKVIDERTLIKIQKTLYPEKKAKRTRRRRRPRRRSG